MYAIEEVRTASTETELIFSQSLIVGQALWGCTLGITCREEPKTEFRLIIGTKFEKWPWHKKYFSEVLHRAKPHEKHLNIIQKMFSSKKICIFPKNIATYE